MKELKPITQWYEQLPEPLRSQAINNYNKCSSSTENQPSLADALSCFWWALTEQGSLYWLGIHTRALNGEFDSKPEAPQPKPIGLSKETKILLSVLLRREFDSLPWYSLKEAAPVIIKAASELELTKLVKEMRSDLKFEIKKQQP